MRIVHLSDLHFGTQRDGLTDALEAAVHRIDPALVVVSGDLTQRARDWQFRQAKRFLSRLRVPVLAVPGNHDVPLYNLFERVFLPWRRWRSEMGADLQPQVALPGVTVAGLNSVNPWSHQRGRVWLSGIARAEAAFRDSDPEAVRIVALHHPLEHPAGSGKHLASGAARGLDRLAAAGTDIILCGHLHNWRAAAYEVVEGRRAMIQIQAGTALSTRLRSEPNDFNLLDIGAGRLALSRYAAGTDGGYALLARRCFRRDAHGWAPCEDDADDTGRQDTAPARAAGA